MLKHLAAIVSGFLCLIFCSCFAFAQENVFESLQGHWVVDLDRTLEYIKNSPKYRPEEEERMPEMLKMIMGRMSMEIKENEIIYYRGILKSDEFRSVPFSVETKDSEKAVLKFLGPADEEVFLTFTFLAHGQMNFKTSQVGAGDFDYYIWKRAEE